MSDPSPGATPQQRFLHLLRHDILKLDAAELDFGIYRILAYRRAQVLHYLDHTLPARIQGWADALAATSGRPLAEDEAANAYYHLHTFFSRYWDEGDFIPRARRGGSAAYAVPYHGQDTHFHWATKGSHYVKSGELFARYAWRDDGREVCFVIERADITKDNAKGGAKTFFPSVWREAGDTLTLHWQWRAPTDAEAKRYKGKTAQAGDDEADDERFDTEGTTLQERVLNAWLAGDDFKPAKPPNGLRTELLARNARRFVRKNTQDFFVHPQLGDFLRGELELYLKHEFVQVWDAPDTELPHIRAKFALVRSIALDLIAFLDQIEQFQATLFEKRKFVLQADYLVQCSGLLRQGGEAARALVAEAAASPAQALEWAAWVGDKVSGKKKPDGAALLARYPHLPLHTRHFDADFKARVLACFDDLEAALGGELVHADNYAALRTLEPAYRERVQCIYIDPPYNTGGDGFLYKDDFTRHSSWLSMMQSRLQAGRQLLADEGVQFTSIDENEHRNLLAAADAVFGADHFVTNVIWQKNYSPKNTAQHFSEDHDYITVHAANAAQWRPGLLARTEEQDAAYSNPDDDPRGPWSSSDLSARNFYSEGVYPLTSPGGREIAGPPPGTYWRVSRERFAELEADNRIWWGSDGNNTPRLKRFLSEVLQGRVPQTLWTHKEVGHTQDGKRALLSMSQLEAGEALFNTIKPLGLMQRCARIGKAGWMLDYFAGSASTGHALIEMNRTGPAQDAPARFLLVEQGEYFDTVTLPRIAKVMTAPEWKDGQPRDTVVHDDAGDAAHWSRRTLPLVRVLRLERYEDSLNALDFAATGPDGGDLLAASADEHLLRYWLQDESAGQPVRLSTQRLCDPFAYRLTLHEPTGPREVVVDLLETARLLLGLVPRRWREATDDAGRRHQWLLARRCADVAQGRADAPLQLLWLRPVDDERGDAAAQAEYEWLLAQLPQHFGGLQLADVDCVLHNRSAFWPVGQRAQSIDALLAERMLERAP